MPLSLLLILALTLSIFLHVSLSYSEQSVKVELAIEKDGDGKSERVNGVFVYLVTVAKSVTSAPSDSHPVWDYVSDLVVSLRYLDQNFNHQYGISLSVHSF